MQRLIVRAVADAEVDAIAAFIAQNNLSPSLRFYDRVQETYLPLEDRVEVVHVIHGARNIRKILRSGET